MLIIVILLLIVFLLETEEREKAVKRLIDLWLSDKNAKYVKVVDGEGMFSYPFPSRCSPLCIEGNHLQDNMKLMLMLGMEHRSESQVYGGDIIRHNKRRAVVD